MRRRQPAEPEPTGTVPPELAIGRVAEVWAEDGADYGPLISAFRRYSLACGAWEAAQKPPRSVSNRLGGAPWSVRALIAEGREDEARERLARHGVTLDRLNRLRAAASRRAADAEARERWFGDGSD